MHWLRTEAAMYAKRLPADYALGTRVSTGSCAAKAGQNAGCDDGAKADCRARVRDVQTLMGYTHFLTRLLANVSTEMSRHVLAYNLKRVIAILGFAKTMKAMRLVGA